MSTLIRVGNVVLAAALLSGCAMGYKKDEAAAAQSQPINCATAQGDLRALAS